MRMFRFQRICGIFAMALLAGCASDPKNIDPYEKTNRFMYSVNEGLDRYALKPLADGYVKFVPKPVRTGLGDAFQNLDYFNVIFNDYLQGNGKQGWSDVRRMALNSTIGIGGILDVATPWGLPSHDNDFGITLGKAGSTSGPYLVLPFFGPSTLRDAPGIGVEIVTNPITWLCAPWYATVPLGVTDAVDARSRYDSVVRFRNEAALDPYVFTRNAYLQYREGQIREGKPPPASSDQDLYDVDDSTAQPTTQPVGK
jgi:phospholipid-binding lipoprotein MlaA